ncbi:MAG TPA: Mov34/MPN/PAD-1 family protein [Thermomicrobiales bacterium]|jgi:proteasome lid subunit RPN8/RPN11|nr:Mov34/MPN/PAD-1 family protein [Thermomicrobiales bacterium]
MVTWKTTTEYQPVTTDLGAFVAAHGLTLPTSPDHPNAPILVIEPLAWDAIWTHARSADVEVGGLLVGEVFHDAADGRSMTVIRGAIPALGGLSSAVSFTFTPDAWDYLTAERDRQWPDLITVGWFHTHPRLGVFYSSTDRATQAAHFNRPWNIGIVVDPLAPADQVALFVGPRSDRLPADSLIVLPGADATIPPVLDPATEPVPVAAGQGGESRWRVRVPAGWSKVVWVNRRPTAAARAAAMGAATGVVAMVIAEWLQTRRQER